MIKLSLDLYYERGFSTSFYDSEIYPEWFEYFGPYTSAKYANTLISLIKSLYKLRTCNLSLNKSAVYSGKYKVCLEYHIGNCMGPCVGYVQEENTWNILHRSGIF